jgi:hypothetical protein
MKLPHWVEQHIAALQPDFTGQIVIEWWAGVVKRMETKTCHQAPKAGEMKRDDRK